jgi:hypothetical protein
MRNCSAVLSHPPKGAPVPQETPMQMEAREFVTCTIQRAFESLKTEIDQEPERFATVTEKPSWALGHVTLAVHNRAAAIPDQDTIFVISVFGHSPGDYPHVAYEANGDGIRKQKGEFPLSSTQSLTEMTPEHVRDHLRGIYDDAMRQRAVALNRGL